MKKLTLITLFLAMFSFVITAEAATKVRGYVKPSTGTYVAPHYKSSSNKSRLDNYSTKGNYNPYTGKKGTVDPYKSKSKSRSR